MVDANKLRGKIVEKGLSQRDVAQILGMSDATFYRKMKERKFDSSEISKMIVALDIENPMEIFFAEFVAL